MTDDARRVWIVQIFERARAAREHADGIAYGSGWRDDDADAAFSEAVAAFDGLGPDDLPILDALASDPSDAVATDARGTADRIRCRLSAERLRRHLDATDVPEGTRYARAFLEATDAHRDAVAELRRAWTKRPELHGPTLLALMEDLPRLDAIARAVPGVVGDGAMALLRHEIPAREGSFDPSRAPSHDPLTTLLDRSAIAAEVARVVVGADDSPRRARLLGHVRALPVEQRRELARSVARVDHPRRTHVAEWLTEDDDPEVRRKAIHAANGAVTVARLSTLLAHDPDEQVRDEAARWLARAALQSLPERRVAILGALRAHASRAPERFVVPAVAAASQVRALLEGSSKHEFAPALARLDACVATLGPLDPPTGADAPALEDLAVAALHVHAANHDGTNVALSRALVAILYHRGADVLAPLLGLTRQTASMTTAVSEALAASVAKADARLEVETSFRLRLVRHVGVPRRLRGGVDRATVCAWLDDPSEAVRACVLELAAPIATHDDLEELLSAASRARLARS